MPYFSAYQTILKIDNVILLLVSIHFMGHQHILKWLQNIHFSSKSQLLWKIQRSKSEIISKNKSCTHLILYYNVTVLYFYNFKFKFWHFYYDRKQLCGKPSRLKVGERDNNLGWNSDKQVEDWIYVIIDF